ncbi:unnamed protein product [Tilletia controversa]|uniref:CRAL-TRIO domain-containing protein n=3 Tax=Tilletia TaxID=13289 RepID=A0A8X7SYR6_9BASI|nr:hypothetical protein CF328_g4052 [Tilletia controversa]KAE8197835.1 hypothetical protein CF336_g1968 [Tilletia laevis]KAE8260471.1 hypothetical protein A4X03_0g3814 [Tilletia caries]KAE8202300.1 hypothetical protein CF335_g3474 [Tilletia laevis]KAE8252611.1 hypothetical protein A4X06_0g2060 [Tilletia controversa]
MDSGHRGNLSSAQNRALLLLWKRFIEACEGGQGGYQPQSTGHARYGSQQNGLTSEKVGMGSSTDTHFNPDSSFVNANGTTTRLTHSHANGHHHGHHDSGDTFGPAGGHAHSAVAAAAVGARRTSNDQLDAGYHVPYRASTPVPSDPALEKYHRIRNNGSHIAKDDRVKDQMRGAVEAKEMNLFLQRYGGARLRTVFWEVIKGEHPDTFMLRCLRARKWNVDRALAVIGNIASFRFENDVFGLVKRGELDLVKTVGGAKVYRNGIAYCWGASKDGLPVCYIEVARHFASNQTQEELKRAIILFQEWLGMLMPPPVSRKIVCFNMTNFGLRNMDWWCVFFLVKSMEMYWPETLERVYVHHAPWFFKPIWTILRPLLDPVVRDKVRFTSTAEELSEHIPASHLPRSTMSGDMQWDYTYPEPDPNENDLILENEAQSEELRAVYFQRAGEFEKSTKALIRAYLQAPPRNIRTFKVHAFGSNSNLSIEEDEPDGADELRAQRDVDATRLRVAWLEWMPFTVGKSKYTRWHVWRTDGTILWTYPQADGSLDYQMFGQGTSLPVLKQSMSLIEEAQRLAALSLAEQRMAASPLSPGSRSARRGRKRDRKPTERSSGNFTTFDGSWEAANGRPMPMRDIFDNAPALGNGLASSSEEDDVNGKTEVLLSPPSLNGHSKGTRTQQTRDFSDTDEDVFGSSSGLAIVGTSGGTAMKSRLRGSTSTTTFGVGSPSKADRRFGHGFGSDAASARAALGAEKAGTGWPSTPSREGPPGEESDQSREDGKQVDGDDGDEEGGDEGAEEKGSGVDEKRPGELPARVLFAPDPTTPRPNGDVAARTSTGSSSGDACRSSPSTSSSSRRKRRMEVVSDSSEQTFEDAAEPAVEAPPRKSVDPGTIALIPGGVGEDPIGQVVYDEDGIPH